MELEIAQPGGELTSEVCYQAVRSRNPRYDGRFFTAVTTTGVYCRPICPARPPRRENVRFYPCAAAAEEAGFRPCRRCRPETSPGTPAWLGTSASVSRALQFISDGALDTGSVSDLAGRLGMGERQLLRLFRRHLGASPVAVAQTRRVHFARTLIDQTDLALAEVAFSAGFSSIRRFNEAVKATFGRAPSELREMRAKRIARNSDPDRGDGSELSLRLPFRPPFDWRAILQFLGPRAIPGIECVRGGVYRRSVSLEGRPGILEVRPASRTSHLLLRLPASPGRELVAVVDRVRRLFDLDADPRPIGLHLRRDPDLAVRVRKHPGMRLPGAWDGFELAVRAILGQQVTVAGATTLAGRLVQEFGRPLPSPVEGLTHLFPEPAVLATADVGRIGMPAARAQAIRLLARAVEERSINFHPASDWQETRARLRGIPGVGEWTTAYIAMRALGDPDALPEGDLGLRRALSSDGGKATERQLLQRSESWRPWRAYAAMHLWTDLSR